MPRASRLRTGTCGVCGRERPQVALSVYRGISYCNDDHNDLKCHERVRALEGTE